MDEKELARRMRENPDLKIDTSSTAVRDEPKPVYDVPETFVSADHVSGKIVDRFESQCTWRALETVRLDGSSPEYRFAVQYLEERIENGSSISWAYEPLEIRMKGQTYTPDFFEVMADGGINWYEVKGSQKLGSQDRASVKFRFTAAFFENDNVRFWWVKEKGEGGFKVGRLPMQGKRKKPSL